MKEKIRRELRKKRNILSYEEINRKSISIKNSLFSNQEYKQADTILFYVSYDNEVFTQALALISKNSCTRSSQLQLRKEDITEHWENTTEAIKQAVDYLKKQ